MARNKRKQQNWDRRHVQLPIPAAALTLLKQIPVHFRDDGCSASPDAWFGFYFRWACRIHDWRYCTRCHPPGTMTGRAKRQADRELREGVKASLPWRWKWIGRVYEAAVRTNVNGSFDTCGPVPEEATDYQRKSGLCRHGVPAPNWMLRLARRPS